MYLEYYLMGIVLLPGLILAIIAQSRVTANYKKYSKVMSKKGYTASQVAKTVLEGANLPFVEIDRISGELTDNYNPETNIISLSRGVHDSTSVAAISIALHEVGHAIQHAKDYAPMKVSNGLVKVSNYASRFLWPLVVIGLLFNMHVGMGTVLGSVCMWAGISLFSLSVIFNLAVLPVEYNASHVAKSILSKSEIFDSEEMVGVNKVLNAAAWTYIAALVFSMLSLLRFILVMLLRRRD